MTDQPRCFWATTLPIIAYHEVRLF